VFVPAFWPGDLTQISARILAEISRQPVPSNWISGFTLLEVANAWWKLVRFASVEPEFAATVIDKVARLPLRVADPNPHTGRAFQLAVEFTITVYDARYLALAEALSIPLVTADRHLVKIIDPRFQIINLTDIAN
jgi:predicted nucleic acid-binding protein